jgi:hypothetical protein
VHLLVMMVLALDLSAIKTEPNLERRSDRAADNAVVAFDAAREAFDGGNIEKAKAALDEVRESVDLAYQSLEESGKDARRNPKFFKKAELKTRDLLRRLEGMAKAVSIEDRALVEKVRDRVAQVHDDLIKDIMKKK